MAQNQEASTGRRLRNENRSDDNSSDNNDNDQVSNENVSEFTNEKGTSKVWDHCTVLEDKTKMTGSYCPKSYNRKCGIISTMQRHLINQHNIEKSAKESSENFQEDSDFVPMDPNSERYKSISQAILNFLLKDLQLFNTVHRQGFIESIQFFGPAYKMTHRTTFARHITVILRQIKLSL